MSSVKRTPLCAQLRAQLTVRDIARMAGVSPSAVSLALNGRKGIGDATRERILAIVERTGFVPNQRARRLLQRRSGNIGVVHHSASSPFRQLFLLDIVTAALAACEEQGYNLVFAAVGEDADPPEVVRRRDVDGVLVIGEIPARVIDAMSDVPMVLVDDHLRTSGVAAVEADYTGGAHGATRHLMRLGHRRIAYLGEDPASEYGRQTLSGYEQALETGDLSAPRGWVCTEVSGADDATAQRCMASMIDRCFAGDQAVSAVFCAADIYAVGALRALRSAGFAVPGDISIMGMDDIVLSRYSDPPLSTVAFDVEGMGGTAVRTLMSVVASEYDGPQKIIFPGEVVERGSTSSW